MSEAGCVPATTLPCARGRALLWLALLAPLPFAMLGFVQGGLLTQNTWEPHGLLRMLVFAAGFAVWTMVFLARRGAFVPATVGMCAAFTVLAVGPAAPLAVCVFLAGALAAGDLLSRGKLPPHVTMLVGIAVYATLTGALAALPVNYPLTHAALLAIPIVLNRRALLERIRAFRRPTLTRAQYASVALLTFALLLQWLITLKPETGSDGLSMHLAIPARVAMEHRWTFDVSHVVWAVMPMNADWCYTAVYLLGGEFAARLLNFAMLLLTVWILVSAAGRLAGILFASIPLVQFVTGSLMVENFWTALLAGSAFCVWKGRYLCAAALGGAAVASKFGAASLAIPLFAMALYQLARRREWRKAGIAAILFLVLLAPPYLNAYLRTGNPVFPFANGFFQSPYIIEQSLADSRYHEPLTWRTLYDLSFFSSRFYEGRNGAAGFQHFLLVPMALALAIAARSRALLALALLCAVYVPVTFRAQANLRYLYPAAAGGAVLIALAIERIRGSALHRASVGVAMAAVLLNLYFLPASNWSHRDFYAPSLVSAAGRDEYLVQAAPARRIAAQLNTESDDSPVGFFEASDIAGLRTKAYVYTWHNWTYWRTVMAMRSPLDYLKYAQELGIGRYVAPADLSSGGFGASPVGRFLDHYTRRDVVVGRMALYRLSPEFTGAAGFERARAYELAANNSASGTYDNTDRRLVYQGAWHFDYQFRQASNGTLAYAKEAGAKVWLAFTGTSFDYVHTKAANRGVAEVWIDGKQAATIDLYSPGARWQAATSFPDLGAGRHEVEVRVTGRRNPQASGAFVDIDAFLTR